MRLVFFVFLASSVASAEEVIPLDQIWGHDLHGTKRLREIDPDSDELPHYSKPETRSPYWKVVQALQTPPGDAAIHNAFVVSGAPLVALKKAASLLSQGGKPTSKFTSGEELYLVFFDRMGGRYVAIERVEKHHDRIQIAYRQHYHRTTNVTDALRAYSLGGAHRGRENNRGDATAN